MAGKKKEKDWLDFGYQYEDVDKKELEKLFEELDKIMYELPDDVQVIVEDMSDFFVKRGYLTEKQKAWLEGVKEKHASGEFENRLQEPEWWDRPDQ